MQVRVLYLGMLKEIAGLERESVELVDGASLADLYSSLEQRFPPLQPFRNVVALAVNFEYSSGDTVLQHGDEVALIPPVSGGSQDGSPASPGSGTAVSFPLLSEHAGIVKDPIDSVAVVQAIKRPDDGAVVVFDGIVRNQTRGRKTLYLEYTAYEAMALLQMERLAQQALANYPVREVRLVHRLGRLEIGESSVFLAVASAHRAAAFDACRWLIDTLKKTVPIWKKEYFEDGAVWADGEPFPPEVPIAGDTASK